MVRSQPILAERMENEQPLGYVKRVPRVLICSTDYTLANPDTLTKYKTAAAIAEKVLQEVSGSYHRVSMLCIPTQCMTSADRR